MRAQNRFTLLLILLERAFLSLALLWFLFLRLGLLFHPTIMGWREAHAKQGRWLFSFRFRLRDKENAGARQERP